MPLPALKGWIPGLRRALLVAGLTAAAYALLHWLSLELASRIAGLVPLVGLASGVAAMAAMRFGAAGVLGVGVGAFAIQLRIVPAELALMLAGATVAGAALMAGLARLLAPFSLTLDYVPSVAKFVLVIAPAGSALAAVLGVAAMHHAGFVGIGYFPEALWETGVAELLGAYLVAPLLLTASRWDVLPATGKARLEGLALLFAMLLLARLMMEYALPVRPAEVVLFVLLPGVLWAALRFSVAGVSLAIFLAAPIVLGLALVSYGGIGEDTPAQDIFALQMSMAMMALGGLFVAAALSERRYSEMRLDMLANHDPLTGLPNRSYFQDFLGHALARAQREKSQVSLLFIDLDRFKHINDTQGHEIGDQVLRVVANRLDELLRADDFVARLGGDEFAVVLTHPPASRAAARVAAKLIRALAESFRIGQRRYAIGASVGISVYPDDASDANSLLRQADLAMYQAKQRRSGFEYYSDELNTIAQQQLALESGLRQAIERGELALVYQPKVDLASGRIVGLEALVRWLSRAGGIVGPEQFIPVAEETGLIVPIGRWVARTACEQWVAWQAEGLDPPPVAVNLSPRQFVDARLADDIDAILRDTGMAPAHLQVEVTESAAMENPARTFDMLDALRQRGLHVYIDDFGTGHSNLGQLKRMPIDALKIDKSLIDDVLIDSDDAEIATAIIRLAHALNLRVVAEGVETPEQIVFLKKRGCDEIQGYVIARPLPPDRVGALFGKVFQLG